MSAAQHRVQQQTGHSDTDGHQTVKPASPESPQTPAGANQIGTGQGQGWTPEPWKLDGAQGIRRTVPCSAKHHRGCMVASAVYFSEHPEGEAAANAARIVSCVNALSGIQNPEAAIKAAREALRAAEGYYSRLPKFPDRDHDIAAELKMLRAALALLEPGR